MSAFKINHISAGDARRELKLWDLTRDPRTLNAEALEAFVENIIDGYEAAEREIAEMKSAWRKPYE